MSFLSVIPNDDNRFDIVSIDGDGTTTLRHDRDYGRLDSAVAKAWTLAKRDSMTLHIDIHPGSPQSPLASPPVRSKHEA